jgi:predicted TIM-barrel fold metal-dependent hydrolase
MSPPVSPADWLAQVTEEPLEPERPIVDPHHHLWDYPDNRYLAAELLADALGHNLRQSVFVECNTAYHSDGPEALRPLGETRYVVEQAVPGDGDAAAVATGIVGFADLQLGAAVAPVLDEHREAGDGRFRGIRHSCSWDPSEAVRNSHSNPPRALYLRDDFREGFEQLARHDMLFEAWCYHPQLPEVADLARAFPHTTIVMDHVGGPVGIGPYAGQREDVFAHWQAGIRALAACDNVVMKLGGLAMPLNGFGWHKAARPPDSRALAEAFAPYFDFCLRQFGVERCMFESNFPVDRLSCSYTVLWNAFKRLAAAYSTSDRDALLHDNALRVYRLALR